MKNIVKISLIINFALLQWSVAVKFDDGADAASSNQKVANISASSPQVEGRQSARHLFDFVGLGTGRNVDPFLRKTNEKCLNGELSECFKSQALNSFDDLFQREVYV